VNRPSWAPTGVDINQPSVARVYDFFLGGSHNFEADRAFAAEVMTHNPIMPWVIRENRAFLRRVVRYLVEQGIDQFIDLGAGIPTVGSVHAVAAELNPDARIIYVDHDPVAIAHSRAILEGNRQAAVYAGDLQDPTAVLDSPEFRSMIDVTRPVALMFISVLHFIADDDTANTVVSGWRERLSGGGFLALSHASADQSSESANRTRSMYNESVAPMAMRTRDGVTALFGGLELVDPGVVPIPLWRPDSSDDVSADAAGRYPGYAGLARLA
jgi:hypothetical protein